MREQAHIARVSVTFEFTGIIPVEDVPDASAEEAVKKRFKFFNPEIVGFVETSRKMAIATAPASLPLLPVP